LENNVHIVETGDLFTSQFLAAHNSKLRTDIFVTAEMMQQSELTFRNRETQLIEPDIPDLPQASFCEDTLERYNLSAGKAYTLATILTFVLMFVIFLIAHPSPERRCLAATTQP
jgi:hypothetical protein